MSISQALLGEFGYELVGTRKVLERVPEAKFAWAPHPKSSPMGRLATHVSDLSGLGVQIMETEELDIAPVGGPARTPTNLKSVSEILANFDAKSARMCALFETAPDAALMVPWTLKKGGNTMFTLSRVAALRSLLFNHMIHHRAQLTVYLRLCDVPVPSLYGPSADETNM